MCSHTLTTINLLTTYTGVGCFGETLPRVILYYILLYMCSHTRTTTYVLSTYSGVGCFAERLPRVTLGRKSTSEAANNLGF
jgi:hypothetical protein